MFFFIGGIQPRTVRVEKRDWACPYCSHFEVYVKRTDQYLSVFFIPLIRVKKGTPYVICESCRALLGMDRDTGDTEDTEDMGDTGESNERRCRSCGRSLDPGFSYCPYCGKPI